MIKIGIIIGSTRPGRNSEAVAKWVYEKAAKRKDAEFELVDLKDYNLPIRYEPSPADRENYSTGHTKLWSKKSIHWMLLFLSLLSTIMHHRAF